MSGDYLWDKSGTPDPEVERLEHILGTLRHSGKPVRSVPVRWWPAAVAAAIIVSIGIGQLSLARVTSRTPWETVGGAVHSGQTLRTAAGTRITLKSENFGRIDLAPNSELRMLESKTGFQRFQLRRGELKALIWAPPQQFVVDTPSSRAIDLGCQYTLSVADDGSGFLRVETGWVAFQHGDVESFIPAGAACRTSKIKGPGVPYFEDASAAFRESLDRFDREGGGEVLKRLLAEARPRDGLTLWHLLRRVSESDRGAVFDRLAKLVALPAEVTREAALRRDPRAMDLAWNALELDSAGWWREWKHRW